MIARYLLVVVVVRSGADLEVKVSVNFIKPDSRDAIKVV